MASAAREGVSRRGSSALAEFELARAAQPDWAARTLPQRLAVLRQARHGLASRAMEFAQAVDSRLSRSAADTLSAEVLPLAEACRFLEREAVRVLAPRRLPTRGRPFWLGGVEIEVHRDPLGIVLILAPYNYPLFLAGAQALQALAAGNAVVLKPGEGGGRVARLLADVLAQAGLDARLFRVLEESAEAGREAVAAGPDKVVLTGSVGTGRAVLADLAPVAVPSVMELSGCDAAFVLPGADLERMTAALRFGLRLNGGATCIGPRRLIVTEPLTGEVERRVAAMVRDLPPATVRPAAATQAAVLVRDALDRGARLLSASLDLSPERFPATLLTDATPEMGLLQADLFAPVLSIVTVGNEEAALRADAGCPYALGATVFGPERAATAFARRVRAGTVVVNDMVVPTADPRLPFGGRGRSGFGVTRGDEGLLEMTAVKAIAVRRGRQVQHLEPPHARDEALFRAYLRGAHAGRWSERWAGWRELVRMLTSGAGR